MDRNNFKELSELNAASLLTEPERNSEHSCEKVLMENYAA
jgi:hypothetical protein